MADLYKKARIKYCILSLFFLFAVPQVKAQDPEFTQFYANPLYLNPAFAGSVRCPRIAINYRNQWPSLTANYITTSASYDQHVNSLNGGLGFYALNDQQGENTVRTSSFNVIYAYHLRVTRAFSIRFGMQAGYFQRSLDWSKLTFGDMIDNRRGFVYQTGDLPRGGNVGNVDFATGVLAYTDQYYAGIAVHHITQPNESLVAGFSALPAKFTAHAGALIPLARSKYSSNDAKISPNLLFRSQGGYNQLNLGLYVTKNNLVGGAWYRNKDAFILLIGVQTSHLRLGYSYDVTASPLTNVSGGSHELSMGYTFGCKPPKRTFRTISCPSF